jgi:glutamate racemase
VAACNTASALAQPDLQRELPGPVVGVVEPGARAAVRLAAGQPIAVIGTEATIGSGAYLAAIQQAAPGQRVLEKACPLLVALVEEGRRSEDPIVQAAVREYLAPLRDAGARVLILGCTHYPLLRPAIAACLGPQIAIVDSGRETSQAVQEHLRATDSLCPKNGRGSMTCYVSDNPARFRTVGSTFLDEALDAVEFVEPERYIASGSFERQPG